MSARWHSFFGLQGPQHVVSVLPCRQPRGTPVKLNQIIAIEKGAKSGAETAVTRAYHQIQKADLFGGLSRVYTPKDDEGEVLPAESTLVIATVKELVADFVVAQTRLFDLTATKLWANCEARADIILDSNIILPAVPVEYLLFLEKRLADCMIFVSKLPTLDPSYSWHWDDASATWRTEPVRTNRSKKVPKTLVKAQATEKHPAQVEVYMDDETIGYWDKTMFSGAIPQTQVNQWKEAISQIQTAVKMAREEANGVGVDQRAVGERMLSLIFG